MNLVKVNENPIVEDAEIVETKRTTSDIHFMAANTKPISVEEIGKKHTIPVFAKDN